MLPNNPYRGRLLETHRSSFIPFEERTPEQQAYLVWNDDVFWPWVWENWDWLCRISYDPESTIANQVRRMLDQLELRSNQDIWNSLSDLSDAIHSSDESKLEGVNAAIKSV